MRAHKIRDCTLYTWWSHCPAIPDPQDTVCTAQQWCLRTYQGHSQLRSCSATSSLALTSTLQGSQCIAMHSQETTTCFHR